MAAMRNTLTIATVTAALAGGAIAASAGATAPSTATAAATRHVEGRVTAIDRPARTFTVRDAQRGTLKVEVTTSTRFERVTFSALRTGQRVDVRATRVSDTWTATKVERGATHATNHDAGDDHGGHGRDHAEDD
ncbi:MAG: hypothetical protein V7607_1292 [Solirubrobacteraceae bacterium]